MRETLEGDRSLMHRYQTAAQVFMIVFAVAGCEASRANMPHLPIPSGAAALRAPPQRAASFDSAMARFRYYSGLEERQRLVVRDARAWNLLWSRIRESLQPAPAVPSVDFSTEMVIVAAMGTRPSGGFAIEIRGVYELDGDVFVEVREVSPGPGCGTTLALTAPVAAVVVPARSGAVRFSESASLREC